MLEDALKNIGTQLKMYRTVPQSRFHSTPRASWQQHCSPTSRIGRLGDPSTIFLVRMT